MNGIVVGVKPVANSTVSDTFEEAVVSVGAYWVSIDGQEIPLISGDNNLISAQANMDAGFLTVTLTLQASSFRTARFDGPDAPERFRAADD